MTHQSVDGTAEQGLDNKTVKAGHDDRIAAADILEVAFDSGESGHLLPLTSAVAGKVAIVTSSSPLFLRKIAIRAGLHGFTKAAGIATAFLTHISQMSEGPATLPAVVNLRSIAHGQYWSRYPALQQG
jgi:hypothetical protein